MSNSQDTSKNQQKLDKSKDLLEKNQLLYSSTSDEDEKAIYQKAIEYFKNKVAKLTTWLNK